MKNDNYGVTYGGQNGTMAALASKQTQQQQMVNKRGSEFKKSAQQMLNKWNGNMMQMMYVNW